MSSYLQIPFLQALGYAIANSLWQIFLLWLIVILVNGIAKQSAVIKYITAVCAQVGSFVWFVTTLQFYYDRCYAASVQAEQLLSQHEVGYTQTFWANGSLLSNPIKAEATLPYLSIAYLFLLLLLLVKWFRTFRFTQQLSSSGLQPANASWQRFVNETADRLNIMQSVNVYLSFLAKSPMTIGYIKPMILLPFASINHLTTEQLEAVLLHELAHIRRSDYLINLLLSVVEIILFFNPFTRLLSKQIKEERENCCDDWVLQFNYDAAMYAEALLCIAHHQNNAITGLQMNAASGQKGELLQRVKRMIHPQKTFNYKHQVIALFLITGLLFSIAWLQPVENNFGKQTVSNHNEVNNKILIEPLTVQVDNPFFNAASLFSKFLQEDVTKSLEEAGKTMQDSITKISLQQAHIAIDNAMPELMTTLSSAGLQKLLSNAGLEAAKSLATVDWKALQSDETQSDDSISLQENNDNLIQNNNDKIDEAKQNADAAKNLLLNLNNLKIHFNKNFLQQLGNDALASLQNINFTAIADSVRKSSELLNSELLKQKLQQLEFRKKQQEWIKKWKTDVAKEVNTIAAPLVPPMPPQARNIEDANEAEVDAIRLPNPAPAMRLNSFSIPVYNSSPGYNSADKTIRIINKRDSSTVSIIIEIKQ